MKPINYVIIMTVFVFLTGGQIVDAQVLNSCDQWANYCSGGYCVYNNLWGENAGPQCITAQSTTQWSVRSTQSGTGVKTYPNSSREMGNENVTIGSLSSCSSSMSVSGPGTGDYCTAWDIWCPEEVMIWLNKYGNVSPWGSFVETATIGGVTWDVYKNGYPGFVRQSNANSMTVDVKSILDYCVSKGWLHSDGKIEKIQGGFEITSTGGQERTFTMNSYSVSFATGGSGTTPPTTPPTPDPTPVPTDVPTPVPTAGVTAAPGTGNGVKGEYFTGTNFNTPVLTRTDPVIDFNWGGGSPDSSVGSDTFSVRWTGNVEAVYSDTYTFHTNTDDGVRLYINNQLLIDRWQDQSATEYTGTIGLSAGQKYSLTMDYFENEGDASAQLSWSCTFQSKQVIPQNRLYSDTPQPTPQAGNLGDVNNDGNINIVDALLVAQFYVGLNPSNFDQSRADTNCSGGIDIVDALLIAQYSVGLISQFC
jgi:hypothetical protein